MTLASIDNSSMYHVQILLIIVNIVTFQASAQMSNCELSSEDAPVVLRNITTVRFV